MSERNLNDGMALVVMLSCALSYYQCIIAPFIQMYCAGEVDYDFEHILRAAFLLHLAKKAKAQIVNGGAHYMVLTFRFGTVAKFG